MAFTDENELIKKSITHVVTEATNPLTKLPPAIAAMNIPIGFTSIIKTAVARHTEHVRQTSQNPLEYYQEMKDYIDRIIQSLADTIPTSQKEASFVCAAYLPTFRRTFNDIVEHTLQDISWYTPEQSETPHATLPAHNKERRTISLPWHDHTLSPLGRSTSVRVNPFDPSVPLFFLPNTGFSFPTPPQFTHTSAPQADGMSHHADFGHTPLMTFSDENNSIKDAIEEVFRQTTKNHKTPGYNRPTVYTIMETALTELITSTISDHADRARGSRDAYYKAMEDYICARTHAFLKENMPSHFDIAKDLPAIEEALRSMFCTALQISAPANQLIQRTHILPTNPATHAKKRRKISIPQYNPDSTDELTIHSPSAPSLFVSSAMSVRPSLNSIPLNPPLSLSLSPSAFPGHYPPLSPLRSVLVSSRVDKSPRQNHFERRRQFIDKLDKTHMSPALQADLNGIYDSMLGVIIRDYSPLLEAQEFNKYMWKVQSRLITDPASLPWESGCTSDTECLKTIYSTLLCHYIDQISTALKDPEKTTKLERLKKNVTQKYTALSAPRESSASLSPSSISHPSIASVLQSPSVTHRSGSLSPPHS